MLSLARERETFFGFTESFEDLSVALGVRTALESEQVEVERRGVDRFIELQEEVPRVQVERRADERGPRGVGDVRVDSHGALGGHGGAEVDLPPPGAPPDDSLAIFSKRGISRPSLVSDSDTTDVCFEKSTALRRVRVELRGGP